MIIDVKLIDTDNKEEKRQYTLTKALRLVEMFLKGDSIIIVQSDGGRIELTREK